MLKRFRVLIILIFLAVTLWVVNFAYPNIDLQKASYTASALAIVHFFFKHVFEDLIIKRIKVSKTRYSFKKTVSVLYLVVLFAVIIIFR